MGLREQSIVGCCQEFVFLFSMVQLLVGLLKQFINNFVFPTWGCTAGFNNNNNNNNCSHTTLVPKLHDGGYLNYMNREELNLPGAVSDQSSAITEIKLKETNKKL